MTVVDCDIHLRIFTWRTPTKRIYKTPPLSHPSLQTQGALSPGKGTRSYRIAFRLCP
jgi:hypothetical protein